MTASDRPVVDHGLETFDRALAAAARSLVVGELPAGVLTAPRPAAADPWRRFAMPLAAAVAIVALAVGVAGWVAPGPVGAPTAAFRSTSDITRDLRSGGSTCRGGAAAPAGAPRMDAMVCSKATPALTLVVVVSEDSDGRIGEIHVTADVRGASTAAADRDLAAELERLIGLPLARPAAAAAARAWLVDQSPLGVGRRVGTSIDGLPIVVERAGDGGYQVVLGDMRVGAPPPPPR